MSADQAPRSDTTVVEILLRLFPLRSGQPYPYMAFLSQDGATPDPYATPPVLPPDVFAAAAHLLDLSGAYHHVVPHLPKRPTRSRRLVLIEDDDIKLARSVATSWRAYRPELSMQAWLSSAEGGPLAYLYDWWAEVARDDGDRPVFLSVDSDEPAPAWWKPATMLLIAADEASRGLGFAIRGEGTEEEQGDEGVPWCVAFVENDMALAFRRQVGPIDGATGDVDRYTGVLSVSTADPDVANVLPKARTAAVGCTLRSLSHHLALLPPRGVARASWTPYLFRRSPPDEQHMNLLLVPFPFSVPALAFKAAAQRGNEDLRWGFFDVEQTWLRDGARDQLVHFVSTLAEQAKKECDGIHGVVLPELALDEASYAELSRRLPEILPEIEILVSGHSGDVTKRSGNFVAVTVYQKDQDAAGKARGLMSRREKHHRWKLDRSQIVDYGLEGVLSPSLSWWEDIDLLSRRVDFSVFRSGSVLSAMICEDLARVDPCQELIRAIGPSIVFALLMDAPQMRVRWPARYATVLADDPGTAVLTLTSRALMARQDRLGIHRSSKPEDRVVALWKDDTGLSEEIACPMGAHAVRLTLSGRRTTDATLDGRDDRSAVSWRHAAHKAVELPDGGSGFASMLGADDLRSAL